MNQLIVFIIFSVVYSKYTNINYNVFTIKHVNHTLDTILNYSFNDIDNNKLHIDHQHNVYSMFTQSYFKNCNHNSSFCSYNVYEQEKACKHVLETEEGQIYYHGLYTDELVNYEVESNGNFREIHQINRIYTIQGLYVLMDISTEKNGINTNCITDSLIKQHNYEYEPYNFYRKMMIYINTDNQNYQVFCPIWELKEKC